ncbi:armadillo repeat protein deleted in velo-cardio-facial syndrome-like [Scleropages formosus]|uniref:Armadillo repeat protein deleted in velo-cardio-facial syndrome-like n=1 Tax=Scleropages formosus TaxID=113540 RepID=A0A0P7YQD6_SCLFO|nr:armadillo repeat protein deleted in velo-cardio-facial syndrome-like [Scleropages formosus]
MAEASSCTHLIKQITSCGLEEGEKTSRCPLRPWSWTTSVGFLFEDMRSGKGGGEEQSPEEHLSLAMMEEPEELLDPTISATVTTEQDPGTPTSRPSALTTDRPEAKATKTMTTVMARSVRSSTLGPDGLPLLEGSPPLGSYTDSIDRRRGLPQGSTLTCSFNSYNGSYGESPERLTRQASRDASDAYGSLSRPAGYRLHPPYAPAGAYTLPHRLDDYGLAAQPQVPVEAARSPPERYSLEVERVSLGPEEEALYSLEPEYGTTARRMLAATDRGRPAREPIREPLHIRGVYDDHVEAELREGRHPFLQDVYPASLPSMEPTAGHHSPSTDSVRKDPRWRDPDLPEVISMLSHPVDPVKSNAAAYLQHLCYENDRIKRDVRQLKGVPVLVGLLDHPRAEVHRKACGALRNISYGRDHQNKVAIRNCDGIPALVRLLKRTGDMEVRELVTGMLPYEFEVIVPHSGWGREPGEDSKPRDVEWTTVFKNTSGCLRNVSSDGAEARRRLRECEGLVDALLYTLQCAVAKKDTDNKSVENCVCILRNLSYHVHKEVPGAEKYQDPASGFKPSSGGSQKKKKKDDAGCFGGKKVKGRKNGESKRTYETLDLPKRTEPMKGYQLLYQPEVVRLYLSLLTESQNYNTLEAAAGALQNLAAGHWTWSSYIRATVRKEKGLPVLVELLRSHADTVVRAVAIALRNLAIDHRNKDLIGSYAVRDLVSNLPSGQQRPAKNLEEDTVVAVLNTLHEIVTNSSENARALIQAHAIQKLVSISRTSEFCRAASVSVSLCYSRHKITHRFLLFRGISQSPRETKAASHVLQTVWSYKELRNVLTRDGWNKTHFQPSAAVQPKGTRNGRASGDDTTLPLMERNQGALVLNPRCNVVRCSLSIAAQGVIFDGLLGSTPSFSFASDGETLTWQRGFWVHAVVPPVPVEPVCCGNIRDLLGKPEDSLLSSADVFSNTDSRDHECRYSTRDGPGSMVERDHVKNDSNRKFFIRTNKPSVNLVDACDLKPQPVDSWRRAGTLRAEEEVSITAAVTVVVLAPTSRQTFLKTELLTAQQVKWRATRTAAVEVHMPQNTVERPGEVTGFGPTGTLVLDVVLTARFELRF